MMPAAVDAALVNRWADALRARFAAHADVSRAAPMQAYMKSSMPFLGVSAPTRRALTRACVLQQPAPSTEILKACMAQLWQEAGFREERYTALELARYRPQFTAAELVATLRPLAPRMYSIASSQKRVGDEVHLTVALVEDEQEGRRVWGAATRHLSLLDATAGVRVPVFVERNERFRLPADASRDVVMIGPGTGVAPFRAFVQERAETGARGRNWLFFGARRFSCDFLYQLEWQEALKKGELARIDLAFSRDTDERVYVQRRIREAGRELYAWLDGGASVYVCGDADRMAPDVHAALAEVIAEHGGVSGEDALERLNEFAATGRYLRDVY